MDIIFTGISHISEYLRQCLFVIFPDEQLRITSALFLRIEFLNIFIGIILICLFMSNGFQG